MGLRVSSPRLPLTVIAAAAVVSALVIVLPPGEVAGQSAALHVAIDTAVSVIALVAGALLVNRFWESRALGDLLLVTAFLLLLVVNLCFSSLPALLGYSQSGFAVWSSAAGRLTGALALAAAAIWPPQQVESRSRAILVSVAGGILLLGAIALVVTLLGDRLAMAVRPSASAVGGNGPELVVNHLLLAVQLFAAFVLGAATVGFERRAVRTDDQLMHWIAATCVLFAFASLNYFLFPSLYTNWVSIGDALRICAYLCLLLGGLGEIGVYRRRAAVAAKAEERDSIARDLHDGLAQDLAFVAGRLRELAARAESDDRGDKALLTMLASAARRALDESRVAVMSLASPETPVQIAVEQTAEEVAGREGGMVLVEAEPELPVSQARKHALLCIVRESVTNALRHGRASRVDVRLVGGNGILLEVQDNGQGFEVGRPGGFGLKTIQRRATVCGGHADIVSRPGEGTVVRVHIPATTERDDTGAESLESASLGGSPAPAFSV
jgi:signal transduction histidine kinase